MDSSGAEAELSGWDSDAGSETALEGSEGWEDSAGAEDGAELSAGREDSTGFDEAEDAGVLGWADSGGVDGAEGADTG